MRYFTLFLLLPLVLTSCQTITREKSVGTGGEKQALEHTIQYIDGNAATKGYLAMPQGDGPFPALILIHEWWGLNDNIRWYADQFAAQGYAALAVDLYNGASTENPDEARALADSVRVNMDDAFANLSAALLYLEKLPQVDGENLASVGWCFGGGWSYQMAKNDLGTRASVIYYGQFNPKDDLSMMRANIIGHFGSDDRSIPVDDVRAFHAALETHSGEHQIFMYENEGHGFARELGSESAIRAWERTLQFLEEQLKDEPSEQPPVRSGGALLTSGDILVSVDRNIPHLISERVDHLQETSPPPHRTKWESLVFRTSNGEAALTVTEIAFDSTAALRDYLASTKIGERAERLERLLGEDAFGGEENLPEGKVSFITFIRGNTLIELHTSLLEGKALVTFDELTDLAELIDRRLIPLEPAANE